MILSSYSMGIGDRFGRQGKAQLAAFMRAKACGADVTPVWNKSYREHRITGTVPASVRAEADAAVHSLGWQGPYWVDADHITLRTIDPFLESSDFFTLDVTEFIGGPIDQNAVHDLLGRYRDLVGLVRIPGIDRPLVISPAQAQTIVRTYLPAIEKAAEIHRRIESAKASGRFIIEISMDETSQPQTPAELLFILAAIAHVRIPVQTIAPRFTGRFNKGIDYVGDVSRFEQEFNDDLGVIAFAVREFGLPQNLKLSVHSGSDKFSLYGPMRRAMRRHAAGIHLKTAGTTWLEELIGLASAGGQGLALVKDIYRAAVQRIHELCAPYAAVIDIDRSRLPTPDEVDLWDEQQLAESLRHDPRCPRYDPQVRQLLHVSYRIAAEMGNRYLDALDRYESTIAQTVTMNLYERHLLPLFLEP